MTSPSFGTIFRRQDTKRGLNHKEGEASLCPRKGKTVEACDPSRRTLSPYKHDMGSKTVTIPGTTGAFAGCNLVGGQKTFSPARGFDSQPYGVTFGNSPHEPDPQIPTRDGEDNKYSVCCSLEGKHRLESSLGFSAYVNEEALSNKM